MIPIIVLIFAAIGFLVVASRIVMHFTSAASTNKFVKFIRLVATGVETTETKTS